MNANEVPSNQPGRDNEISPPHVHDLVPVLSTSDHITGETFSVAECRSCRLGITVPQPSAFELSRYYPTEYYGTAESTRAVKPLAVIQNWLTTRKVARVVDRLKQRGRVLDVGCGRGSQLDAFRKLGWEPVGTEISEEAAAHAMNALGLTVEIGTLEAITFPAQSFDLILLSHVLEHVHDPRALLNEVHRLLRPGGTVIVSVPNWRSLEARLTGPAWFGLEVPRHLVHFTPRTLTGMLADAHLRVVRIEHFWWWQIFMFVQSCLNRLGFPRNHLHEMLRTRASRTLRASPTDLLLVPVELLLALPLTAIGSLATLTFAALRQGSTLSIVARRTR